MRPPNRNALFPIVAQMIGASVIYPNNGWPGIVEMPGESGTTRIALHVSNVTTHSRAAYERRFQNPASGEVVSAPYNSWPVLVGLGYVEDQPVLVAVEGASRLGREARFSVLFNVGLLQEAAAFGWGEYTSTSGERITAVRPELFGAFVDAVVADVVLEPQDMMDATVASGIIDNNSGATRARVQTIVSRLVRRARFGKDVCQAYDGRCGMCALGLGLPEGAHIWPASAPGSPDAVWNGIALCPNHHKAFDRHLIWVNPDTFQIHLHQSITNEAQRDPAAKLFADQTALFIRLPMAPWLHPRPDMFEERYALNPHRYEWA